MEQALAEAEAEKLEEDPRVKSVSVKTNDRGVFLDVVTTDRMAINSLKRDLHQYQTWAILNEPEQQ